MDSAFKTELNATKPRQDIGDNDQKLAKDFQVALQQNAKDPSPSIKDGTESSAEKAKEPNKDEALDDKKGKDTVEDAAKKLLDALKQRAEDKEKNKNGPEESNNMAREIKIVELPGRTEFYEVEKEDKTITEEDGGSIKQDFELPPKPVKVILDPEVKNNGGADIGLLAAS